jgi:hypothetical protein
MPTKHSLENMVGLGRLELPTSPLSGVRSNQLSYKPAGLSYAKQIVRTTQSNFTFNFFIGGDPAAGSPTATLLRLHPSHEPYRGKRPPEG